MVKIVCSASPTKCAACILNLLLGQTSLHLWIFGPKIHSTIAGYLQRYTNISSFAFFVQYTPQLISLEISDFDQIKAGRLVGKPMPCLVLSSIPSGLPLKLNKPMCQPGCYSHHLRRTSASFCHEVPYTFWSRWKPGACSMNRNELSSPRSLDESVSDSFLKQTREPRAGAAKLAIASMTTASSACSRTPATSMQLQLKSFLLRLPAVKNYKQYIH